MMDSTIAYVSRYTADCLDLNHKFQDKLSTLKFESYVPIDLSEC